MKFIVRGAGLGDNVALLPVLEAWRKDNPDEVFTPDGDHWQQEIFKGHPALGQRVNKTRAVWTFNAIATPVYPGNLSEFYASQKGLELEDPTPRMYLSDEEVGAARQRVGSKLREVRPKTVVAMDSWAGWPTRRWGWGRFAELVVRLSSEGVAVVEVGAKSDAVDELEPPQRLPGWRCFYGQLLIRETAAVISECDLYIGNDSGLAHVAAAVGVPQVTIYGAVPWYQRAYWNTTRVISSVRCRGQCNITCAAAPVGNPACLEAITVEEVYHKVQLALDRFVRGREGR